jgi:hypothetical protein
MVKRVHNTKVKKAPHNTKVERVQHNTKVKRVPYYRQVKIAALKRGVKRVPHNRKVKGVTHNGKFNLKKILNMIVTMKAVMRMKEVSLVGYCITHAYSRKISVQTRI